MRERPLLSSPNSLYSFIPVPCNSLTFQSFFLPAADQIGADRSILADELINLLVAGRDTTSGTLSFGIYKLAEYPEIAEKLRAEILEKVGPTRSPTYNDIKDMKCAYTFDVPLVGQIDRPYRSARVLERDTSDVPHRVCHLHCLLGCLQFS